MARHGSISLHHGAPPLSSSPALARVPRQSLPLAESLMTSVRFGFGDALCREGEIGRQAFLIVSGEVAVTRDGVLLGRLGPGDIVGEMALLGDGYRNATATALGPVTAQVMNPREFASLLDLPGVSDAVRAAAADRAA